jgi:hypothetical protein
MRQFLFAVALTEFLEPEQQLRFQHFKQVAVLLQLESLISQLRFR